VVRQLDAEHALLIVALGPLRKEATALGKLVGERQGPRIVGRGAKALIAAESARVLSAPQQVEALKQAAIDGFGATRAQQAEAEEPKAGRRAEALAVRKDEAKLRVVTQLATDVSPRVHSLWAAVKALPEGGETLYGLAASARSDNPSSFHGVHFDSSSSTFRYSFEGIHYSATTALGAALELVLAKLGGIPALLAFNEAWVKTWVDAQLAADVSPG